MKMRTLKICTSFPLGTLFQVFSVMASSLALLMGRLAQVKHSQSMQSPKLQLMIFSSMLQEWRESSLISLCLKYMVENAWIYWTTKRSYKFLRIRTIRYKSLVWKKNRQTMQGMSSKLWTMVTVLELLIRQQQTTRPLDRMLFARSTSRSMESSKVSFY
jgi:hypothetical protein